MGLIGLSEETKLLLYKILNEIENTPSELRKIYMAINEYGYPFLLELKNLQMIDFSLVDTVPHEPVPTDTPSWMKKKMFIVSIEFYKYYNTVYIKSGNEYIKYYRLYNRWRQL